MTNTLLSIIIFLLLISILSGINGHIGPNRLTDYQVKTVSDICARKNMIPLINNNILVSNIKCIKIK